MSTMKCIGIAEFIKVTFVHFRTNLKVRKDQEFRLEFVKVHENFHNCNVNSVVKNYLRNDGKPLKYF